MSTPYERLDASDPIDQASELEQMQLRIALENQKATRATLHPKLAEVTDKKKNTVRVACLCHYCDEILKYTDEVSDPADLPRFCDEDCRDGWQKEQDMLVRTGKLQGNIYALPGLKGRVGSE